MELCSTVGGGAGPSAELMALMQRVHLAVEAAEAMLEQVGPRMIPTMVGS